MQNSRKEYAINLLGGVDLTNAFVRYKDEDLLLYLELKDIFPQYDFKYKEIDGLEYVYYEDFFKELLNRGYSPLVNVTSGGILPQVIETGSYLNDKFLEELETIEDFHSQEQIHEKCEKIREIKSSRDKRSKWKKNKTQR